MSVIDTLITDRTAYDLIRLEELEEKVRLNTATADEVAEWLGNPKGAYNASDLNRVGEALLYLMGRLNGMGHKVTVTPKTDWTREDRPTPMDMAAYLGYVQTIRGVLSVPAGTPNVPADMEELTLAEANDIERILLQISRIIEKVFAVYKHSGAPMSYAGLGGLIS